MTLPLSGYTVVSIDQAVAAPLATRNLADLGARVIKIERADTGDFARSYDDAVLGTASHFVWLNRGKESVALDLKDPDASDVVRQLIDKADVFLQNLAPGATTRLGLDAASLRARNPRLIVVDICGYGEGGPSSNRKAYDMLIQAEAGLISVTGAPEAPAKVGIPAADIAAGMYCSQAVLAALLRRERTGEGATIDISMLEATAEWMGHPMYIQMYADRQIERMGLSHVAIAPYNRYPTSDGEILIGIQNDSGWRTLVTRVFGRPELADDERFRTNILRVRNRADCDELVARYTRSWPTADLDARLSEEGVPAAQINDVRGLVDHPQLEARRRWREVDTEHGQVRALLPPINFSDVDAAMGAVPAFGQHTVGALREAGLDENQIAALLNRGAAVQHKRI